MKRHMSWIIAAVLIVLGLTAWHGAWNAGPVGPELRFDLGSVRVGHLGPERAGRAVVRDPVVC